jgi:hypothetical protein
MIIKNWIKQNKTQTNEKQIKKKGYAGNACILAGKHSNIYCGGGSLLGRGGRVDSYVGLIP